MIHIGWVVLPDLSIYYTQKNIKQSYRNNKIKISGTPCDEEFKLPDGYYSVSNIQEYFECTITIIFKIKNGYCLEPLTPETMKYNQI